VALTEAASEARVSMLALVDVQRDPIKAPWRVWRAKACPLVRVQARPLAVALDAPRETFRVFAAVQTDPIKTALPD